MQKIRVANKTNGIWTVNQWIKKAIFLSLYIKWLCQKDLTPLGTINSWQNS